MKDGADAFPGKGKLVPEAEKQYAIWQWTFSYHNRSWPLEATKGNFFSFWIQLLKSV
jgi:hypothetical protein